MSLLNVNGKLIQNQETIANSINDYFLTIAEKLTVAKQIDKLSQLKNRAPIYIIYRVRHKSVNTPLRHTSVNTPLSHKLRARCVQQAVRGIKGVNRLMPHPALQNCRYPYPNVKFRYTSTEEVERL